MPEATATTADARGRPVVDAEVRAIGAVDGVEPVAREPGGDAGLEPQRRAEEQALQGASVLVVERRLAAGRIGPSESLVLAAVGHEPRPQERAVPRELPLVRRLLEQHLERVPWLEVALEINLAAEDLRDRHRELNGLAGRVHRGDDRRMIGVDAARGWRRPS